MNHPFYSGRPMRFAHRGMVQAAPENTCGAFEAAIDYGCEGIELDLQLSADGEIIVAHDSNFTRMTLGHPHGCNDRLRDLTAKEICAVELPYANHLLDAPLPRGSENELMAILPLRLMGQEIDYVDALQRDPRTAHLMRFADFDRWLAEKGGSTVIELEIKAPGMARRLCEIIDGSPNAARYIAFSGVPAYNEEIQSFCRANGKPSGLRLGANLRFLNEETERALREWDLFEIGLNAEHFTAEDVRRLNYRGVQVLSNLGDYPAWWEKLCRTDVMGFKTNYADAFTRWYAAHFGG